jgi:hypothetical protein
MRFARLPSPPRTLVWTGDGQRLIIGCNDGHVRVVDWETAEIIADKSALPGRIYSLFFDSRIRRVFAAGNEQPVSLELES